MDTVPPTPETHKLLILLRLDASRLFNRIKSWAPDYLRAFALKRTRSQFAEVFKSRYDAASLSQLQSCSEELIISLDHFYTQVDELHWYLKNTEEMPNTVRDRVDKEIHELEKLWSTLDLYISGQLGYQGLEE